MKLPLYPELPSMRCDSGCTECCGPATVSESEFAAIQHYIKTHQIKPVRQGITCPLYIDGRCSVYEVRPYICRMFGHSYLMDCPRGYNVNLPRRQEHDLLQTYIDEQNPQILLHSLAYDDAECEQILNDLRGESVLTEADMRSKMSV